jgi:hypothetical protein
MRCNPVSNPHRARLQLARPVAARVRRQLTPEGGRAIEILGHAIEYLADEYAAGTAPTGNSGNADPRIEAIQVLKALNRAIYFASPKAEPVFRRIHRWFAGVWAPELEKPR